MEETTYDLNTQQSDTIDSNGNVTIEFGPSQFSERWRINRYTTVCNGAGGRLTVYRNTTLPGNQIDFTLKIENDVSDVSVSLLPGERIRFVYEKCNPGTVVSVGIMGTRHVKGRRAY